MKNFKLLIAEFKEAYKGLLRHRFRAILSTLGIILGSASLIAMISIGEGAKEKTLKSIQSLGVDSILLKNKAQTADSNLKNFSLNYSDYQNLKDNLPYTHFSALRQRDGSIQTFEGDKHVNVLAVTASFGPMRHLKMNKGFFFSEWNEKHSHAVCVLGKKIANQLGMQAQIGNRILISGAPFEVLGILEERNSLASKDQPIETRNLDTCIFIPLGSERILSLEKRNPDISQIDEIHLKVTNLKALSDISHLSMRILKESHGGSEGVDILIPMELMRQAEESQHTFNLVLGSVAGMSLLVGGVGIMNILLATVYERTREIGIRRAFGATRVDIVKQFLFESLLLTLIGGIIGILAGIFLAFGIGFLSSWPTIVPFWSLSLALGMSCGIGLIAGLYPANKAAKVDPMQALKTFIF